MEFDRINEVLSSHKNIKYLKEEQPNDHFNREVDFIVRGQAYKIQWWPNISYLFFNFDNNLLFNNFKVSNTWPNNAKFNLQFYNDDDIVLIIPIEY